MKFVVAILLLMITTAVQADARLEAQANFVAAVVRGALSDCILMQKTANMHYKFDEMAAYNRYLDKLYKCKSEGPDRIKAAVQKLRVDLKAQNKSEVHLKDFMMTYQKINGILGDTSNDQADQYEKILAIKGEAIAAELD
jgi:hypothetical protein